MERARCKISYLRRSLTPFNVQMALEEVRGGPVALCVRASLLPMSCAVVEVLEWVADVLDNHGRQIGPRHT